MARVRHARLIAAAAALALGAAGALAQQAAPTPIVPASAPAAGGGSIPDLIIAFLTRAFGPLGPVYALAALAAFLIASATPLLLKKKQDPIEKLGRPHINMRGLKSRSEQVVKLRYDQGSSKLDALAPYLEPKDEAELSSIRHTLLQAGYRSRSAVRTFYLARGLFALLFVLLAIGYLSLRKDGVEPATYLMVAGGAMGLGYLAPSYWVTRRKQQRQEEISNGFPDALDLMLICVEAGQSLDQALMRVSKEIKHAHGSLAEEFEIISSEMRAGKDRATVLRDFAKRTGVNDVSSFVTVLVQSATFGTSVAEALRVYAAEMRDKRLMRAEEKANVLPTKLTLGTMMFTVPPLMLILIGPSLVDIVNALTGFGR
ncbi:type II secretion system F family protein [Oceanicella actignis]|uniref:type II secretion system F family protein n=1 Tax=Oceanicella actignis TaxID=1189325 RepID=UPI0011E72ACA|nr:type II secretion system F family protein [Oceanicella actignis]TYO88210.1 tight adherence protein C [Oceanicella actignis]